jgi:general secretion pathway protein F
MPRFAYTARDRGGKSVTADLEAPSRKDALRLLSARGLQVASVNELAAAPKKANGSAVAKAVVATPRTARRESKQVLTRRECLPFLEALYDLASSGLSAGEAVRLLSVRIKAPRLRALCPGRWPASPRYSIRPSRI